MLQSLAASQPSTSSGNGAWAAGAVAGGGPSGKGLTAAGVSLGVVTLRLPYAARSCRSRGKLFQALRLAGPPMVRFAKKSSRSLLR
jgi:hypothetical protein